MEDHWNTLSLLGEASVDALCATHVHISPKAGTRWNLDQLKQVAQAVIYFEEALKAILAPSRREHRLTKRNKANNRYLKDRGFGSCCELIQGRRNIDGLVSLLQPYQIASSQPKQDTPVNRAYAWNFENTKESKDEYQNPRIGTIGASYGLQPQQV